MGLMTFFLAPAPLDVADNGLSAFVDGDVLHDHLLLAAGAVAFQRFHLRRERARQLVESALGTVLLGDVIHVVEAARRRHR